jgi:hypothetical protein
MSDRYERERIRDEHIREEQRRDERKRIEASQEKRREIEDGFRRLIVAGREVERLKADSPVHRALQNVIKCEIEIEHLLDQLKTLPNDPGDVRFLLYPGSNTDIRRKALEWEERFINIRLSAKTEVWTTVKKIQSIRNEVDKYRFPPASPAGISHFRVRLSDTARNLLSELGSKLLWLDQFHIELDSAKQNRDLGLR